MSTWLPYAAATCLLPAHTKRHPQSVSRSNPVWSSTYPASCRAHVDAAHRDPTLLGMVRMPQHLHELAVCVEHEHVLGRGVDLFCVCVFACWWKGERECPGFLVAGVTPRHRSTGVTMYVTPKWRPTDTLPRPPLDRPTSRCNPLIET